MNQATLALAFAAGMVASFNPCGFSLLPAYIGAFVSNDRPEATIEARIGRAVAVAGSVSVGFVVVFLAAGLVLDRLASSARAQLPWVTIVIGSALVLAGIAGVAGWKPTLRIPALQLRSAGTGTASMVSYGAIYAVASLSCTLGPFLAVTGVALNQSTLGGIATYIAYALGMGTVILAISVGAAVTRTGLTSRLRLLSRHAPRLGGVLMVVAGSYAVWYGQWELAVYSGDLDSDPIIDAGERVRLWFVTSINRYGALNLAAAIVAIAGAVGGAGWALRRQGGPVSRDVAEVEGERVG